MLRKALFLSAAIIAVTVFVKSTKAGEYVVPCTVSMTKLDGTHTDYASRDCKVASRADGTVTMRGESDDTHRAFSFTYVAQAGLAVGVGSSSEGDEKTAYFDLMETDEKCRSTSGRASPSVYACAELPADRIAEMQAYSKAAGEQSQRQRVAANQAREAAEKEQQRQREAAYQDGREIELKKQIAKNAENLKQYQIDIHGERMSSLKRSVRVLAISDMGSTCADNLNKLSSARAIVQGELNHGNNGGAGYNAGIALQIFGYTEQACLREAKWVCSHPTGSDLADACSAIDK